MIKDNAEAQKEDRRSYERLDLELYSYISFFNNHEQQIEQKLLTRNISSSGAYLETDNPLPVGSVFNLILDLPLDELSNHFHHRSKIQCIARVVRADPSGMAVTFNNNCILLPEE